MVDVGFQILDFANSEQSVPTFLKIYVVQEKKLTFKKVKKQTPRKANPYSFAEKIRVLRKRKIF